MIELLQAEVDVEPGRKPTHDAGKNSNTVVVRLTNDTELENLITLSIKCDELFWKNSWVTLQAESAPNNSPDQKVKEPEYNNDKTAVRVYVPRLSTWDVRIRFEVPKSPLSRAGVYAYKVVGVAQHGMEQGVAPAPEEKQGLMVMRPFYDWSIDVDPAEKIVKIWPWRRKGEFSLKVQSRSNDWIYCDLVPPSGNKELTIELPTQTVAVPPSDLEKEASVRSVPIYAKTGLYRVRGERQPLNIQVGVTMLQAPTVPPLDEAAQMGGGSLNLDSAVSVKPTAETRQTTNTALVFCPPVPSTLTGFMGALKQNFMGLIYTALTLMVFIPLAHMFFERLSRDIQVEAIHTTSSPLKLGGQIIVTGQWIGGSRVWLQLPGDNSATLDIKDKDVKTEVDPTRPSKQTITITVPADLAIGKKDKWEGDKIEVHIRRPSLVGAILDGLMPHAQTQSIVVGEKKKELVEPTLDPKQAMVKQDKWIKVTGKNLLVDGKRGKVFAGDERKDARWTANAVWFKTTAKDQIGQTYDIVLTYDDFGSKQFTVGKMTILDPLQPGGDGDPAPSGGAGAGGGGGNTGGGGGGTPKPGSASFESAYSLVMEKNYEGALKALSGATDAESFALTSYLYVQVGYTRGMAAQQSGNAPMAKQIRKPYYDKAKEFADKTEAAKTPSPRALAIKMVAEAMLDEYVLDNSDAAIQTYRAAVQRCDTEKLAYLELIGSLLFKNPPDKKGAQDVAQQAAKKNVDLNSKKFDGLKDMLK